MNLLAGIKRFLQEWQSLRAINALDEEFRQIFFYAEGPADWAHLEPILRLLLDEHKIKVTCVTSAADDFMLRKEHDLLRVFCIGTGIARTIFFKTVQSKAFVMTLTDLDGFYLKRSEHPVHYFYVFHSLISIHAAYNKEAFLAYDSIFCTGRHHVTELKKQRRLLGLQENNLLEGGYCRLDEIAGQAKQKQSDAAKSVASAKPVVLIAPTWGEASLVGKGLESLIELLTAASIHTILRLHPMTIRQQPDLPQKLQERFGESGFFVYDGDTRAIASLLAADLMIADQGGSAIEFALGLARPVIFLATPAKVHNPSYKELQLPLFEEEIRARLGKVLALSEMHQVPELAVSMHQQREEWRKNLENIKQQCIFNNGKSARAMAGHLSDFIAANGLPDKAD